MCATRLAGSIKEMLEAAAGRVNGGEENVRKRFFLQGLKPRPPEETNICSSSKGN
jgi:hypothetical protein